MGTRLAGRLTLVSPPFSEAKDAIKFICKDLWHYRFHQQASRLQANKKGVYVIHDQNFVPLQTLAKCTIGNSGPSLAAVAPSLGPLSHPSLTPVGTPAFEDGSPSSTFSRRSSTPSDRLDDVVYQRALLQIQTTAGMIRGFMAAVGFSCIVEGHINGSIPSCAFNITVQQTSSQVLDPTRLLGTVGSGEDASI